MFRVRSEDDPRVRFRPSAGEDPTTVDYQLGRAALWLTFAVVLVLTTVATIQLLRPTRTESDGSFDFSEECGGEVGPQSVDFERVVFPKVLRDTLIDQNRAGSFDAFAHVLVRDDEGSLGSQSWALGRIGPARQGALIVSGRIDFDRAPAGEVHCVAWSSYDRNDPDIDGPVRSLSSGS